MRTLTTYPTHSRPLPSDPTSSRIASTSAFLTSLASTLFFSTPAALTILAYQLSSALLFILTTTYRYLHLFSHHALLPSTTPLLPAAKTFALSVLVGVKVLGELVYKKTERFRDACFYHFMVWILNPNALWLLLFHPAWVLVGGVWVWWCW